MTIRSHVQAYSLGAKITLYILDLTAFGLDMVRIVNSTDSSGAIKFGGETFAPHPLTAEGFELTSAGSLPRPTFTVSNVDDSFTALVEQNDDLHGAILHRIRTYDRYLDGRPDADGSRHLPIETYVLSQKTSHDDEQITWACAALMDQEGTQLPNRVMSRDYCSHDTRRWNAATGAFDYTLVTCPYAGDPKDAEGKPCAPQDEVFSRSLSTCCMARFGANAVLPTRAFPGLARLRNR